MKHLSFKKYCTLQKGHPMTEFVSASIVICVVSETELLKNTISALYASCNHKDIGEILMVYPDKVTDDSLNIILDIEASATDIPVKSVLQKHPGLGGALKDAFELAGSSHILGLPADKAIDLSCVPILIDKAKENPDVIFSTSRWLLKGSFSDYNKIKLILNRIAQLFLRILFKQNLTDLTNPVQIAPASMYKSILWESSGFAILLELVLKPLRLGYRFIEIPVKCFQQLDGKPKKSLIKTVANYFIMALHVRFMKKINILK